VHGAVDRPEERGFAVVHLAEEDLDRPGFRRERGSSSGSGEERPETRTISLMFGARLFS